MEVAAEIPADRQRKCKFSLVKSFSPSAVDKKKGRNAVSSGVLSVCPACALFWGASELCLHSCYEKVEYTSLKSQENSMNWCLSSAWSCSFIDGDGDCLRCEAFISKKHQEDNCTCFPGSHLNGKLVMWNIWAGWCFPSQPSTLIQFRW